MKKIVLMMAIALMSVASVKAQGGQMSDEERAQRRAEMIQRQGEELAKDLKLSDNEKTSFMELYTKSKRKVTCWVVFSRAIVVWMDKSPRPGKCLMGPSMPSGSSIVCPIIW